MATCGSLQHIFDKPLPEKTPSPSSSSSLLETLSSSWNQLKPPIDHSSFTELFGELHFKDTSFSSGNLKNPYPLSGSKLADSLQLCTEGLGSESSADVEDLNNNDNISSTTGWQHQEQEEEDIEKRTPASPPTTTTTRGIIAKHYSGLENQSRGGEHRRLSRSFSDRGVSFPPPISCIGKTGKPWVCFKSYREDGRFVLKEVRIPTQEFLHACREDGRLKLQFVQPDNEISEQMEDEDEEDGSFMEHDGGDENDEDDECMNLDNAKQ
ncbi:unnamed protein product [Linum trigynum]|uniref:FAF domain-containing protein n=1 Tax=Linum trigynum TaxID=586398 RepID=A0AAV2G036_9ROSI